MKISEFVRYEPETGKLYWRVGRGRVRVGDEAGNLQHKGYLRVRIDGKEYQIHRLAWYLTYGRWPEQIDHINRDRTDNRICNLRVCTTQENRRNSSPRKHSLSKYKGVTWNARDGKWYAQIGLDGKGTYLGYFDTEVEAAKAYNVAALKHFGEFAAINEGLDDE